MDIDITNDVKHIIQSNISIGIEKNGSELKVVLRWHPDEFGGDIEIIDSDTIDISHLLEP